MLRGDICLVDLEPARGSEANKQRPAVVVSNDGANATASRLNRGVVTVVPVLRAGLGMAEGILDVMPEARVGHLGLVRDELTLEPRTYLERLPSDIDAGPVILVDPMLATGGSADAAAPSALTQTRCTTRTTRRTWP